MEVSELLSQAVLDTSGIASRTSTPKRPGSLALATLLPLKPEDSTKLVDTSSQVSTPEDSEMDISTREEIHVSPPPLVETPGPNGEAPSMDVAQLQEEANKALDHLLVTRSSLDARQRRQVSDFAMALCQIELETTEVIKETKALCACTIWDVETCQMALISKAEVWHATCLKEIEDDCSLALAEAENLCSTTTREAESSSAFKACSTQQSHAKDIQCLEADAIEEEGKDCLTFLTACGAALRASPSEGCGIMVTPYHLLLGNAPTSNLLSIPPGVSPPEQEPDLQTPPFPSPTATRPSLWSKLQHHLPDWVGPPSPSGATSKVTPEEPPHSKWKEEMPFHKAMSRSHQEAFSRDSRLVQKAREDYYQENCPHFNSENSCDLMDVFWNMIESTGLLGSEIYKIQETWTGQHELEYTNYALKTLLKGLKFFHPVSLSESPKVMGLTNIHHPDALHHFNRVTHCPWCRKEGQNEGTIINHLQTMHYKLGLVCEKCLHCPSVTSEAIKCHGQKSCQLSTEGGLDKSSSSA